MARSLLNRGGNLCERPPVFSVTPDPVVSKPAFDPQPRQARGDQSSSDGFAALVDSNAASDADRPARPAPDAPRRDARGTDAPSPPNDRTRSDASAGAPSNDSGKMQQETETAKAGHASATGDKPAGKTKSASGDTKSDDTQNADAAVTAATPVIPAIATDPVAVVIAAAANPAAIPADDTASPATTAIAGVASVSTVITPADASAAQTSAAAEAAITAAATKTDAAAPTTETAATDAPTAATSAAATVIKPESGKTETVAKGGEADSSPKDTKNAKHAADPSVQPATDQAIKPEAGADHSGDTSQQHEKAASETISTDTEATRHTAKGTTQSEHRAAAPAPQLLQPTDPALVQPSSGFQQQPVQTHTANLTAIPVPAANSALADAPVPLNGLAADIALRAAGGNSRFEIRLDPAELGRIDVRLDVDKHGNVTSHLTVERPATLDMLRNDAPRLQQALENAGLKTGDSGLQFSLRDQSSSGRDGDNGSGHNAQRVVIAEEDTIPAQVAGRTYGRMLGSSSGVDIRI